MGAAGVVVVGPPGPPSTFQVSRAMASITSSGQGGSAPFLLQKRQVSYDVVEGEVGQGLEGGCGRRRLDDAWSPGSAPSAVVVDDDLEAGAGLVEGGVVVELGEAVQAEGAVASRGRSTRRRRPVPDIMAGPISPGGMRTGADAEAPHHLAAQAGDPELEPLEVGEAVDRVPEPAPA